MFPSASSAESELGRKISMQDQIDAAKRRAFKFAHRVDHHYALARLYCAAYLEEQDRFAQLQYLKLAIRSYRKALQLDPRNAYIMSGLAWCLEMSGDFGAASQLSSRIQDLR